MRVGIDRAHDHAAFGIEGVEPVAGGEPDVPAVERQAMHVVGSGKGSVFAKDLGGGRGHDFILGSVWLSCRPERSEGPHGISTSTPVAIAMRSFAALRMTGVPKLSFQILATRQRRGE